MQVRVYKKIADTAALWNELYKYGKDMSFFQSLEWNTALEMNFHGKKDQYFGCKLLYYVFDDSLIAPIVVDRRRKEITLLGQEESSDYLSLIYRSYDEYLVVRAILYIMKSFPFYDFKLDKINQSNPLVGTIRKGIDNIVIEEINKDCVYIPMQCEGESFYDTLSKGTRQNYRTAKNRMKKDGASFQVTTEVGIIEKDKAKELYELYKARRDDCDSRNNIVKTARKVAKAIVYYLIHGKSVDLLTYYSQNVEVFLSEIYINGELAAFCEGNYNNNRNVISIARVATKAKYYPYSPGQVLLIDTIEQLRGKAEYFDLTRGSEDYKFKLGGIIHTNKCYTLVGIESREESNEK